MEPREAVSKRPFGDPARTPGPPPWAAPPPPPPCLPAKGGYLEALSPSSLCAPCLAAAPPPLRNLHLSPQWLALCLWSA